MKYDPTIPLFILGILGWVFGVAAAGAIIIFWAASFLSWHDERHRPSSHVKFYLVQSVLVLLAIFLSGLLVNIF